MDSSSPIIREEKFEITDTNKKFVLIFFLLGLIFTIAGYFLYHPTGLELSLDQIKELKLKRLYANLLINAYYFLLIALMALVFIAVSQLSNAGWYVAIRRIPEAMSEYLNAGSILLILVIISGLPILYHWAHSGISDSASPFFDKILFDKSWYLNKLFFLLRLIFFMGFWIWAAYKIRTYSRKEDVEGSMTYFRKSHKLSAVFVLIFAFSFTLFSIDVVMSIDAHWYSTIFAIYNFCTGWVGSIAAIYILTHYLRSRNYLNIANDEHQHDLGKLMFAFSVFWTYIWVSQFLLMWYTNIPEEVKYFNDRLWGSYQTYFFINVIMNFAVPFFLFMRRDWMRSRKMGYIVAICVLLGHWLDVYLMVMPGALNLTVIPNNIYADGLLKIPFQGFGLMELGSLLTFSTIFIWVTFKAMTKANLYPTKHPYTTESALHDVGV